MAAKLSASTLDRMIRDGGELAILDVREEGAFSAGHLLFASSMPLSRLEVMAADLAPRRSVRIALCDAGDGLAQRAAARLERFGYTDLAWLDGGVAAWEAAGRVLFTGVNVPSKAFGEFVEANAHTPGISAEELKRKLDDGEDLVVLDSRPIDEFRRMNIPTGIDAPGAELAYRVHDVAPSPETLVVVNCAGRTRSIIGAQSLINAGLPNPVAALRNGTMGWELAGYRLERGEDRRAPGVSAAGLAKARAAAQRVAKRFSVASIDPDTLDRWRAEADRRSLYLLDVRGPDEYEAGHLPGSIPAPGGQLVQTTDRFVAARNARLVLIDDTGVRATMTASWLIQMGWTDVAVLDGGLEAGPLERGPRTPRVLGLDEAVCDSVTPAELDALIGRKAATVVDLGASRAYRAGHVPGAWFAVRSRIAAGLDRVPVTGRLVFTSEDGTVARLAAAESADLAAAPAACLEGGTEAWAAAGLPLVEGEENMADAADDVWLKPYERAGDVTAAMNEYLSWELDLMRQVERDGTAGFRHFPE